MNISEVTTTQLPENVDAITLTTGKFPAAEDESNVLYVRECVRVIAANLIRHRSEKRGQKVSAAVVGQPGIGKSYSLFYFAHRFLQEGDIDIVVFENAEVGQFFIYLAAGRNKDILPTRLRQQSKFENTDSIKEDIAILLDNERAVYLVDMTAENPPSFFHRVAYTVFSSSPRPYWKYLRKRSHKLGLRLFSPPLWTKGELGGVYEDRQRRGLAIEWTTTGNETSRRTFDRYYVTFGGTMRPMHRPDEEFEKIGEAGKKLNDDPVRIIELLRDESETKAETTHALFAEVGGSASDGYRVKYLPTKRVFRSTRDTPRYIFHYIFSHTTTPFADMSSMSMHD